MLHQACHHKNFPYVLEIMETCLREDIRPNKKFMERLVEFKKICKDISNDPVARSSISFINNINYIFSFPQENKIGVKKTFQKGFMVFKLRYKTWLEKIQIDETEDRHPWTQYRQIVDTDVDKFKDTSVRFKRRRLSKFRVKTSTKTRY